MEPVQPRLNFEVPGTKFSMKSSQMFVSSGVSSVDDLIGGGLPVGTVTLIEEDKHGSYAQILLKYFLAEGVYYKHNCLIATLDKDPNKILKELPAPIDVDPDPEEKTVQTEKMVIAFRYENIKANIDIQGDSAVKRHYDLSKNMPESLLEATEIYRWKYNESFKQKGKFENVAYEELLSFINQKIIDGKHRIQDKASKKNILRIGIQAIGSPLWSSQNNTNNNDLIMFLYCLRALVKQAYAVAFITVPSYLHTSYTIERCLHSADLAVKLDAFSGTNLEDNTFLSDYHGFFNVTKLAAINSFLSLIPAKVEFVFQLRRKKFVVKMLHLPPDVQLQEDNNKKGPVSVGCGSSDKHLLEF